MKKGWKRLLATVLAVVMVATSSNAWSMQVVAEGADATVSGNETSETTESGTETTEPTPDANEEPVVEDAQEPEDETPTDVVVTITGNSATFTYDGEEHSVSGYTVSSSDSSYTEADFSFGGNATVSATEAGTYNMGLSADAFTNNNENFNAKFEVTDGVLTIEKAADPVEDENTEDVNTDGENTEDESSEEPIVEEEPAPTMMMSMRSTPALIDFTIKTESASKEYDNTPLTAGVTATGLAEGHTFEYTTTSITQAGRAVNEVLTWDIKDASGNSVKELYAEPKIVNGYLEVTPRNVLLLVSSDASQQLLEDVEYTPCTYTDRDKNGNLRFSVTIYDDANLYTEEDYEYIGNVSLTVSEVGIHYLPITEDMFVNKNNNFYINVQLHNLPSINVYEGSIPGGFDDPPLYAFAGSATKEYDGNPLTNDEVRIPSYSNAENVTAVMTEDSTITNVGSVKNVISSLNNGPSYCVKVDGTLTVFPRTGVTVTITPRSKTVYATGSAQTVDFSDYDISVKDAGGLHDLYTTNDFVFNGNATITATEAGTYNLSDYISATDFENTNTNFADVNFVVADGGLTIKEKEKVTVQIKGHSLTTEYDGTEKSVSGYDVSINNANYTEDDFSFNGNAEVKMTDVKVSSAGFSTKEYMGLMTSQFVNNNPDYDVTFSVTDGWLKIEPNEDEVVVHVKGKTQTYTYDGQRHSMTDDAGFDVLSISNDVFKAEWITYGCESCWKKGDLCGDADKAIGGTNVGTYNMGYYAGDFFSTNENFSNVTFVLEGDASVVIEPRPVDVTITGNTLTETYDGTEKTVSGYNISFTDNLFKKEYISFSGSAVATGTNAGTYNMELSNSQFSCTNSNFAPTYNVTDGALTINPCIDPVVVTIKGNNAEYTYDGTEKSVEGYTFESSNPLYTADDFNFSGTDSATGTNAGTYEMGISADDFKNTSKNFANVTFVVEEGTGELTINKATGVVVNVTGKSGTVEYDGNEHSVSGYTVEDNSDIYSEVDFNFSGTAEAKGTDVGAYPMGLSASQFTNTNDNFEGVTFNIVEDGKLTVDPYEAEIIVTIKGTNGSATYDGKEHSISGYKVSVSGSTLYSEDFVKYNGSEEEMTAKGTDADTYFMGLSAEDFENTNKNYKNVKFVIDTEGGQLTINPIDKVTVTITENSKTVTYNGSEQSVTGYAVSSDNALYTEDKIDFSGEAVASGKDAGEYDMELTADDFANKDTVNFKEVEFVIVDGGLTVNPVTAKVTVTVTGNGTSYTYDGTEHTVSGYTITSDNQLYGQGGEDVDFTFDGEASASGTNAGTYDMGISADDFENINKNFTNVEFVVAEGSDKLTIDPLSGVVVTISGSKDATVTYDGEEHTVEGYTVSVNNDLYKEADIVFSGTDSVSGTNAGTYPMGLKSSDFTNNNPNFKDVTFEVVDGALTINPVTEKITVTIKGNGDTVTYDGNEHNVGGYEVTIEGGDGLFTEDDITFAGNDAVKGTDAGTYEMPLSPDDFKTDNPNFENVEFVIDKTGGQLIIEPLSGVKVTITENSDEVVYNGEEHSVTGYTVETSSALYTENCFSFNGTDKATGTDAGSYAMEVNASDFANTSKNFTDVTFEVVDGGLEITPITDEVVVTITETSGAFTYDGEEKSVEGYSVTAISNSLYTASDFTYSGEAIAKGTKAGTYGVNVDASKFTNTNDNFTDVRFEVVDGYLTITASDDEVVVYITENSDSLEYNGKEQSVTGYEVTSISNPLYKETDFSFTGDATATGKNVGQYDMELKASDFTNNNTDFAKVTFVIVDGSLTITKCMTPITVTVTGNGGEFEYDGEEKTVTGFEIEIEGGDGLFTEDDVTYTGKEEPTASRTDVGETSMGIDPDDFDISDNFGNVTIEVEEGSDILAITAIDGVVVTITENSKEVTYNRTEQSVEGYTVTSFSNALYTEDDFDFAGEAVAKGTNAGFYDMNLTAANFANNNSNFTNVEFVIVDGGLTIKKVPGKVIVTIEGGGEETEYTGEEQTAGGYDITIEDESGLYTEDDVEYKGEEEPTVSGTDVGEYPLIGEDDFENLNDNFEEVEIVIKDGTDELVITPMKGVTVTITENSNTVTYNGKEQSVTGYTMSASTDLYTGDCFTFSGEAVAKGTNAGSYDMEITASDFVNTSANFESVTFEVVDGGLTIDPITDEIIVTVTGTSGIFAYDGTEKKVEGYDISVEGTDLYKKDFVGFDGEAIAKGTEPGEYFMEISEGEFSNSSENFTNVKFVIDTEGGKLTITDERFTLTIHYVDGNGKKLADDHVSKHLLGESFKVVSPTINGYTPNYASINSDENGMPAQDVELTVTYTANPVNTPDDGDDDEDVEEEMTEEETTEEETTEEPTEEAPVTPPSRPSDNGNDDDDDEEPWIPQERNDPPSETPVREPQPVAEEPQKPIVQVEESTDMEVSVDENGMLTLTPIGDGETPLANWMWGDEGNEHACNIANFLMMMAALVIYLAYTKRMKSLQARVFELNEELGMNQAQE